MPLGYLDGGDGRIEDELLVLAGLLVALDGWGLVALLEGMDLGRGRHLVGLLLDWGRHLVGLLLDWGRGRHLVVLLDWGRGRHLVVLLDWGRGRDLVVLLDGGGSRDVVVVLDWGRGRDLVVDLMVHVLLGGYAVDGSGGRDLDLLLDGSRGGDLVDLVVDVLLGGCRGAHANGVVLLYWGRGRRRDLDGLLVVLLLLDRCRD